MGLEQYKGVYIYAQQVDNEISSIAFELLGKGKELAADLGTDIEIPCDKCTYQKCEVEIYVQAHCTLNSSISITILFVLLYVLLVI